MAIWDFRYLKDSDNQIKYAQISAIDPDDPDIKMFVPNFPVQNMAFLPANKPAKVRNRVGTTNGVVKIHFSFPAAITADLLALVGHNFSSDATITVYGGSSFDPATSLGTITWREGTMFKLWSSGQSYKYFKLEIDDPANPYGDFQIGYAVIGSTTSSGVGYGDYSLSKTKNEADLTTESGTRVGGRTFQREAIDLAFPNRSLSDFNTIKSLFDDCVGSKERLFVIPNSDRNDGFFGTFMADSINKRYVMYDVVSTQVSFLEENAGICADFVFPIIRGGEPLAPEWVRSRASTAYYKNANLQLVEAAIDECRTSHYYDYGIPTILLEPERTNELSYTEDFSSVWGFTRCSRTANAIDEPRDPATGNAIKLVEDTSTNTHYSTHSSVSFTSGAALSISIFLKASERYRGAFYITNSDYFGVIFDLNAGTISNYSGASGAVLAAEIERYSNGWYRLKVTGTMGSQTSGTVVVRLHNDSGTSSYTGDGASGYYMWGAQFEEAFLVSSYISCLTTGNQVRSYDYLYRDDWNRQLEPITYYTSMVYAGEYLALANTDFFYFSISGTGGLDPRFIVWCNNVASVIGNYNGFIGSVTINSGDDITNTDITNLVIGHDVEFMTWVDQFGQNHASMTSDGTTYDDDDSSNVAGFPCEISMERVVIGDSALLTGNRRFPMVIKSIKLAKNVQTLDYMRQL